MCESCFYTRSSLTTHVSLYGIHARLFIYGDANVERKNPVWYIILHRSIKAHETNQFSLENCLIKLARNRSKKLATCIDNKVVALFAHTSTFQHFRHVSMGAKQNACFMNINSTVACFCSRINVIIQISVVVATCSIREKSSFWDQIYRISK